MFSHSPQIVCHFFVCWGDSHSHELFSGSLKVTLFCILLHTKLRFENPFSHPFQAFERRNSTRFQARLSEESIESWPLSFYLFIVGWYCSYPSMDHRDDFQMMTTTQIQSSQRVPFNALHGFKSIKLHFIL